MAKEETITEILVGKYGSQVLPTSIDRRLKIYWEPYNILTGGLELGTIIEVYGPYASGKSLLMNILGATVQQNKGRYICFNTEAANRDKKFLKKSVPCLKYDKIEFFQPDTVELVFDCIRDIIDTIPAKDGNPVFIGVDSIAACAAKHEAENPMETVDMTRARQVSKGLRLICSPLSKRPIVLFIVTQNRTNIGRFFTKDSPTGGRALPYYMSTMLKMNMTKYISQEGSDKPAGQEGSIEVVKSRFSVPGRKIAFSFFYESGIGKYDGLLDLAITNGIVTQQGSWLSYKEDKFQRKGFNEFAESNKEFRKEFGI
jgi:protein RecA